MPLNETLWCADERRSAALRIEQHPLNGIDFVEFVRDDGAPAEERFRVEVTFLKAAPAITPADVQILGGVRIVGIGVAGVAADPEELRRALVFAAEQGDFSTYVLALDAGNPALGLDPERAEARFGFRPGCFTEFDCRPVDPCRPAPLDEPELDYLARDYQSFRRLFLDFIAARNPDWRERLPADLSIALVEILAYAGDHLSYMQDAGPGTESFFETCLHRISMQRHLRLIDYAMHDGRNAVTFVQFDLDPAPDPTPRVVPAGTRLCTRIAEPLRGEATAPGVLLPAGADFDDDPALRAATVFETTAPIAADAAHNVMFLHTWGDVDCCLGAGAREAWLCGRVAEDDGTTALFAPALEAGDYLLLEEVRSPVTGAEADADPTRRAVVRIEEAVATVDPVYTDRLTEGALTPRLDPDTAAMPLLRVRWRREDALTTPFCLSHETATAGLVTDVSVARGNVAPADHGRTVRRDKLPIDPGSGRWPLASLVLPETDLTRHAGPFAPSLAADGRPLEGRHDLDAPVRAAVPAVHLRTRSPGDLRRTFTPAPHLGDSGPYGAHFVAETDDDGITTLRFGDNVHGLAPHEADEATAFFRTGSGRRGNISAGALVHAVASDPTFWADPLESTGPVSLDPGDPDADLAFAEITRVRQPLPAALGVDPETIAAARALAAEEVKAIQFRAGTAADWREVALRHPDVAAAKARFRWVGSWHCVFVAIHPADPSHLVWLPGGGVRLTDDFAAAIGAHLTTFKLAGTDLKVRAATYVPLEIDIRICVLPSHFRGQVVQAVGEALSSRIRPDGRPGFFYLPALGFGEDVYLSRLYAAVEAVRGVESAEVTLFERYWEVAGDALELGRIEMGDFEIARLDNDPNFAEQGVLRLTGVGGR